MTQAVLVILAIECDLTSMFRLNYWGIYLCGSSTTYIDITYELDEKILKKFW